ncbi:MAG: hypothetical protein MPW14_00755 [Candidatus Manganitrophus sp.]|nr:MAG: hypothetical protein MPW14_00755 [Candidatus Manganitrophus sp.]
MDLLRRLAVEAPEGRFGEGRGRFFKTKIGLDIFEKLSFNPFDLDRDLLFTPCSRGKPEERNEENDGDAKVPFGLDPRRAGGV